MHTLMDNRIKNIVESFDFPKLNNNHPKNAKAVDQIRKDYFMEDEIGWEIWEGETIEQKIKRKDIVLLKPYYSFRVSSPDIYGESAIITHEIYKEGNKYIVRDTTEQN